MDYVVPLLEAAAFIIPFVMYISRAVKAEQRQDDDIERLKSEMSDMKSSHTETGAMLHSIENNMARMETKLDILLGGKK